MSQWRAKTVALGLTVAVASGCGTAPARHPASSSSAPASTVAPSTATTEAAVPSAVVTQFATGKATVENALTKAASFVDLPPGVTRQRGLHGIVLRLTEAQHQFSGIKTGPHLDDATAVVNAVIALEREFAKPTIAPGPLDADIQGYITAAGRYAHDLGLNDG